VADGTFRRDLFFAAECADAAASGCASAGRTFPLLVAHCLEAHRARRRIEKTISDEELKALLNYDWPGNVRELETPGAGVRLSSAHEIQLRDLHPEFTERPSK